MFCGIFRIEKSTDAMLQLLDRVCKLDKSRSTGCIDGIVALAMVFTPGGAHGLGGGIE